MGCEYRQYRAFLGLSIRSIACAACCGSLSLLEPAYAQLPEEFRVRGRLVEANTGLSVPGAYVINRQTEKGVLSEADGRFEIKARPGDTLIVSHLSYRFYRRPIALSDRDRALVFELREQNYLLDEAGVYAYKLSTNDPRDLVLEQPLIPSTEQIEYPIHTPASLANPVDFLYERFGKTPRQMAELRLLMEREGWRNKLQGSNRKALQELTGMNPAEVEAFAFYCSGGRIRSATDYELLRSLLECYERYQRQRSVDEILNEYDRP